MSSLCKLANRTAFLAGLFFSLITPCAIISGTRLIVLNNRLTDVGGGGIPGFIVDDLTNSRIEGNTFAYTGRGPVDGRIVISGRSKGNVYRNNSGFTVADNTR